jgi:hypothetical protein
MTPQRGIQDGRRMEVVVDKLNKVLDRRYLGGGPVKSLTTFFDAPKGQSDVHMVYNGTINGFDDSIPLNQSKFHWVRWHRAGMGLKSSPYQAYQAMLVVEEIGKGNPLDPANPFRWDEVQVNLPGSPGYGPSKPWLFKFRKDDGCIACNVLVYINDLRVTIRTNFS